MEPWGGLCCVGAAALYLLSRRTARDVDFLKSVTRVDQLKDLESTVMPSIVAVSGTVGSETPIKCEHSGILAVILQETAEQQYLKRNWKFSWVQDTALVQPVCKEVPWYLEDGTGRVNVAGAQSGIGFALTAGGEAFEKPEPSSLVRGTLDYLRGLKMLGIRRIERVLPIGTPLTVVGQTIKDDVGDVSIQKADQGPFYVSPIPLDQLISKAGKWSRRFEKASMCLALVGVILISKPVIKYILVRTRDLLVKTGVLLVRSGGLLVKTGGLLVRHLLVRTGGLLVRTRHLLVRTGRQRLLQRRVVDGASTREERVTEEELENSLDASSRDGDTDDLCIICVEQKCDVTFAPCGHKCCCLTCSLKLQGKPCPLCREGDGDTDDLCIFCVEQKCDVTFAPCGHKCCCLTCSLKLQGKPCPLCREGDGDTDDLCIICLEQKCDAIFIPCGHVCCCLTCSLRMGLEGKPCPLCREGDLVLKIYRS